MDDYRTAFATSGQVVDLWASFQALQAELAAVSQRLAALESGDPQAASAGPAGSNGLSAGSKSDPDSV